MIVNEYPGVCTVIGIVGFCLFMLSLSIGEQIIYRLKLIYYKKCQHVDTFQKGEENGNDIYSG